MANIDHHQRAKRLQEIYEGAYKVREESIDEAEITLDGEIPKVPYRYVAPTYDGSESWLEFYNSLDDAKAGLASQIMGEIPWAPGNLYDLDTGDEWSTDVHVTLEHLDAIVRITRADGNTVESRCAAANAKDVADGYNSIDGYSAEIVSA